MEYFDVLDEDGEPTGARKLKDDVHRDGDWHAVAHVWIANSRNEVLLQRRANTKRSWPGVWDISVGAHFGSGESPADAALREIKEELGLDMLPEDLQYLFTVKDDIRDEGHREKGFNHVFVVRADVQIDALRLRAEEVAEVKFAQLSEVALMVRAKDPALMPHWEEYEKTVSELQQ